MMKEPDSSQEKMGRGMIVGAWLLLLGFMTFFFNDYLSSQNNPNQALHSGIDPGVVTLQRNRAGHYIATALINKREVRVLLDTGATYVSVPGHIAEKLQLKRGRRYPVITANGSINVFDTVLESVQIGGVVQTGVRANINPAMHQDEILIGMNFLKQVELIQRGELLTLRQY